MAVPEDRRVIFSSYVVPKESFTTTNLQEETEEGFNVGRASYTDYRIDSNVSKRLGGKGISSISETQWNDGWASMLHPRKVTWDSLDDDTDVSGNRWEDEYSTWSGTYIAIAPEALTSTNDTLKFLYIKNVDDTNFALLKIQDTAETFSGDDTDWDAQNRVWTEDYKIKISPGASICLRGDGSDLKIDEVLVAGSGTGTEIEYIIAK